MTSLKAPIKKMNKLLIASSMIEFGAGFALLICPSGSLALLARAPLVSVEVQVVVRICGAGIFSLGIACWNARNDTSSRSSTGIVLGMMFYNITVGTILVIAGTVDRLSGVLLWPGFVLHSMMAIWCVASVWHYQSTKNITPQD